MDATGVHHVGVTVRDLDRAVAFYEGVSGLECRDRFSVGGEAFATGVDVPGATGSFAHLDDGVETLSEPQTTESGTAILFVRDPEGNLIEILEP